MKNNLQNARDARKPNILFECKEYRIERIPNNFRIIVKSSMEAKIPRAGIDRDYYSNPSLGIEEAHKIAKQLLDTHFKPLLSRRSSFQFARKHV